MICTGALVRPANQRRCIMAEKGIWRPAGPWGSRWQDHVRDFHPELHRELTEKDLFFPLAYEADVEGDEIWEKYNEDGEYSGEKGDRYYRLMSGAGPRPLEWNSLLAWQRAKKLHVEGEIFDRVIFPVGTALAGKYHCTGDDRNFTPGMTRTSAAPVIAARMAAETAEFNAIMGKEPADA